MSTVSPERIEALQLQYRTLCQQYCDDLALIYDHFDRLVEAYSHSTRHYHNLEHISEMLRILSRLTRFAQDGNSLRLAAWYHDAVYDPTKQDNEERSAEWARQSLAVMHVPEPAIQKTCELILSTKDHTTKQADPDTAVFLDADLSILAASEMRYARYAQAIRQEYAFVPDDAYQQGRQAVLEKFLARQTIFQLPLMQEEGEAAARRNLEWEIENLKKPVTQGDALG